MVAHELGIDRTRDTFHVRPSVWFGRANDLYPGTNSLSTERLAGSCAAGPTSIRVALLQKKMSELGTLSSFFLRDGHADTRLADGSK
jgi:hypothetical protein